MYGPLTQIFLAEIKEKKSRAICTEDCREQWKIGPFIFYYYWFTLTVTMPACVRQWASCLACLTFNSTCRHINFCYIYSVMYIRTYNSEYSYLYMHMCYAYSHGVLLQTQYLHTHFKGD
jgi:hypothetical protein